MENNNRKELIKNRRNCRVNARNSMGCDESWYNPYFAIAQVFTDKEIDNFSDSEVDDLIKLADAMSEAFY